MHSSTDAESTGLDGARYLVRVVICLSGGILLQVHTSSCQEAFASIAGALRQPLATGIGNGLSTLTETMVLNLFI
ncbi:MAG: hypothetical protein JW955_17385 [Sedimentisphaerales bacterium]|nr:hypothetical protein [Sedimentisphaerales bacterium]